MQIINCNRGDMSLLFHSGVKVNAPNIFRSYTDDTANLVKNNTVLTNYVSNLNNYYQSNDYLKQAQELSAYHTNEWLDIIVYLVNKDDISVGTLMQQYIMASPYVANAFDTGLIGGYINGYQHDYVQPYTERTRYLQATNGLVVEDENSDDCYVVRSYTGEDQDDLCIEEQIDIDNSWRFFIDQIKNNIDPTDM